MTRIIVVILACAWLAACTASAPVERGSAEPSPDLAGARGSVALPLADAVMPHVFTLIAHDRSGDPVGQGSAFLWDQGYLVTNAHVIAGAA